MPDHRDAKQQGVDHRVTPDAATPYDSVGTPVLLVQAAARRFCPTDQLGLGGIALIDDGPNPPPSSPRE